MNELRLCDDPSLIDAIVRSAGASTRHDAREPGYIDHPLVSYKAAYVDGRLAGIFTTVCVTNWEVEAHVALARHALPQGRALARLYLDEAFADPELARVTASIIGTLRTAINFVRKMGFVDEGRRRDACRVDGTFCDVVMLGLTRGDWLACAQSVDIGGECEVAAV